MGSRKQWTVAVTGYMNNGKWSAEISNKWQKSGMHFCFCLPCERQEVLAHSRTADFRSGVERPETDYGDERGGATIDGQI